MKNGFSKLATLCAAAVSGILSSGNPPPQTGAFPLAPSYSQAKSVQRGERPPPPVQIYRLHSPAAMMGGLNVFLPPAGTQPLRLRNQRQRRRDNRRTGIYPKRR